MKTLLRFIAFALIISLLPAASFVSAASHQTEVPTTESPEVSTVTWEDVYAGIADPRTMYDPLDPSTVPAIIGYETAYKRAHVQRLYAEEGSNLNTIIFLNANQTKTVYLFDHPVKYVDENGNIKDITLDITGEVGSSGTFRTESNSVLTTFSRNLTDGISLNSNGLSVTMTPLLPQELNSKSDTSTATATTLSAALATKLSDETVSYNYDAKTTIEYALTYTGFKEDIVVSEYTGQTTYDFILETNGLTLEENNGSFYLTDNDGNIRANIGDIIIFTADEQNNTLGWLTAKTITANQKYLLTVNVDEYFLKDEKTAYPIRIDPTLEINFDNNGSGAIEDVTINSLEGSSGSSGSLFIGKRETYGISRVLMKFPGLDLTQVSNSYNMESAIVEIRDILGGSDELVVNCHMFTGNAWTESTASWSTVDPNNYSEIISTNTVSYSIGAALPTAHRYQFDITQAVRGWMTNSDSQNKGIIFKTTDEAENSTTCLHKTFASYNRSSYKPSLLITYYETTVDSNITQDTKYLNNKSSGKYLRYVTPALSLTAGTLAELSSSIQWKISLLEDTANGEYYTIQSIADPNRYLSASFYINNTNVFVTNPSTTEIPSECQWSIWATSLGGVWIKNRHTQRYLCIDSSGNITTTTNIGSNDSYDASAVWRMPSTSYYGSTDDHTVRELANIFNMEHVIVNIGSSALPKYEEDPTVAWCSANDFSYSIVSGSAYILLNGDSIYAVSGGNAKIQATHKVTGHMCIFEVSVCVYSVSHRDFFDQGFLDRTNFSASEARKYISLHNKFSRRVFAHVAGVNILFQTPSFYSSYADRCAHNSTNGGLDTQCTCFAAPIDSEDDIRHKNNRIILNYFKDYIGSHYIEEGTSFSLWTGYRTWEYSGEDNQRQYKEIPEGAFTHNKQYIMMLNKVPDQGAQVVLDLSGTLCYTRIHELGHCFNLPHNYCAKSSTEGAPCKNPDCAFCKESPYGRDCVMASRKYIESNFGSLVLPENLSSWFCNYCSQLITQELNASQ